MGPLPRRSPLVVVLLAACTDGTPTAATAQARMAAALEGVSLDCDDPVSRYYDVDGDGHGDAAMKVDLCAEVEGFVDDATDCDGLRADISPSSTEICGDGLDNDCSGGDAACPPPDLATDAYTLTSDETTGELGARLTTTLDLDGDGLLELAVSDAAHNGERGRVWVVELPDPVPTGTSATLASTATTELVGDSDDLKLGQGLATGWWDDTAGDRTTLAVSCAGPVSDGTNDLQTAVFLFQSHVGTGADRSEADAILGGAAADPVFTYQGVESLGMGRWEDGTNDQGVLAAAFLTTSRISVVPMGSVTGDAPLDSLAIPLATPDTGIDLGDALHWTDLDGDGLDELVIGAPDWDADPGVTEDGGALWIVAGAELEGLPVGTENLLDDVGVRLWNPAADLGAGTDLASADLDQDGEQELIVGSFEENSPDPATIHLIDPDGLRDLAPGDDLRFTSPRDGIRITVVEGDEPYSFFGMSVAGMDGHQPRVAVGTPGWDGLGTEADFNGGFWLFDTSDAALDSSAQTLVTLDATYVATDRTNEPMGSGMASAGDVDGDGQDDLLVSGLGIFDPGRIALLTRTGAR